MTHGGWHDHEHEIEDDHHAPDGVADASASVAWAIDNVELTTVGIDIGSATSHLMFSFVRLRRQGRGYSSRFVVVDREVLHRSPILLTPYRDDGAIDADALATFVDEAYAASGIDRAEVGAGAVILTGVARERANAKAIAELFAEDAGRFVCASAGHNMEALLAAHGSGAVERSRGGETVLNVDVGGGTTKLSLCVGGDVVATLAVAAGSRLVVLDADGRPTRVEPWLSELAAEVGLDVRTGAPLADGDRARIVAAIADRIVAAANGRVEPGAVLAGALPPDARPDIVVFSGGVAEFLADHVHGTIPVDDLGPELGRAIADRAADLPAPLAPAGERIRATVIGASQFTMQVSGNTVHVTGGTPMPIHNLPVVAVRLDDDAEAPAVRAEIEARSAALDLDDHAGPIAIAIRWQGEPRYPRLRAIADGLAAAHRAADRGDAPLVAILEADVGASLGAILTDELGLTGGVVAIDGIELGDLDYVDLGERLEVSNVVPIVVKSLLFPSTTRAATPATPGRT